MDAPHTNEISTIASDVAIIGEVRAGSMIRIAGKVNGQIHAQTVEILQGAKIEGDITATLVTIEGEISGTLTSETVRVMSTGSIDGRVVTRNLQMEEGASLEADVKRPKA